jgi:hypothetical protein
VHELGVADVPELRPRRDSRVPERLGEPHVPDAGDETLIDERLAHEARLVDTAKSGEDLVEASPRREQVGAERPRPTVLEPEHGAVPLRCLPLAPAQDEPRPPSTWHTGARLQAPAPVHAEMATEDDAALEAQEEVLADGVHGFEAASVDDPGDAGREASRVRALGLDTLSDENLEALRDAMDRVAFGHGTTRAPARAL